MFSEKFICAGYDYTTQNSKPPVVSFAGGCSFMNSCFIFEQKSIYEKYFS